jgi:hypothetical protein
MTDAQGNSDPSLPPWALRLQTLIFPVAYSLGVLSGRLGIAIYRAQCALYPQFRYEALPPGEHFRFLELQPGVGYFPLVCNLVTAPLEGAQFEAVSYVWGSPDRPMIIWCNGRPLRITHSLFMVLCRLRDPHSPRRLWADGICINQDDVKEKGHQVGFMGKIYQAAQRVLLYAGFDCGEDGEPLRALLRDVIDSELQDVDSSALGTCPWPEPDDPLLTDSRWAAVNRLIRETWFDRGWVLREAALARSGLLIWGDHEYDWDEFMLVLVWVTSRASTITGRHIVDPVYILPHLTVYRHRHEPSLRAFRVDHEAWKRPQTRERPLLEYLRFPLSFSDVRDRIYAFLDLATGSLDGLVLQPNYEIHVDEVFHDFAERYIRAEGDTRILDYVMQFPQGPQSTLPSWVPRWDLIALPDKPYRSIGGNTLWTPQSTFRGPEVIDRATLKVHGVAFDSIRFLSEPFDKETTPKNIIGLASVVRNSTDPSPYPASTFEQAFFSTLTRNEWTGARETWYQDEAIYVQRLHEHKYHPSSFEWGPSDQNATRLAFVHECLQKYIQDTRFMITERGYMGLVPTLAQKGDVCSIIFGCTSPSLLRPTATKSAHTLLGSAYVLGSLFTGYTDFDIYGTQEGGSEKIHEAVPTGHTLGYFNQFGRNDFNRKGREEWTGWAEERDIYLL